MTRVEGEAARLEHNSSATTSARGFARVMSWSFIAEGGGQFMTVLMGVILAALVGPRAYGVVALATVYVLFIELVQRQGIASALIQRRDLSDEHADSAFWLVVATSVVLTGVSALLAGWWADIYGIPQLRPVVIALSSLLLLKALSVVQEALLRRRMDFRRVALRTLGGNAVGGAAGIAVAIIAPSVWALVVQQVVTAAVSAILLWWVTRWRPRFRFSTAAVRSLFRFSSGSFLSSLGVFGNNRGDVLVVGLLLGPLAVGIYALCTRLIDAVLGFVMRPVQSMALPELSAFQQERSTFLARMHRLSRMSGIIALPAFGVLAAVADPLTRLLGAEWRAGALALALLASATMVRVVASLNGPILQALGRAHLQAAVTWTTALLSAATLVVAATWLSRAPVNEQLAGVAVTRLAFYLVAVLLVHLVLLRLLVGVTVRAALQPFAPPMLGAAAAILGGASVGAIESVRSLSAAGHLIVVALSAIAIGGAALLLADVHARAWLLERRSGGRRQPRAAPSGCTVVPGRGSSNE